MAEITKELRAWAEEFPLHGGPLACVLACADRIDERHEDELGAARAKAEAEYDGWYPPCEVEGMRRFAERLEAAASKRADVTIFGVDYMACPLDADGVPIHIEDVMEWPDGKTFEVVGIGDVTLFYVEGDDDALADWTGASTKRHHHAPTVEDVLREMLKHFGAIEEVTPEVAEYIAEYAAKLTLRGDE